MKTTLVLDAWIRARLQNQAELGGDLVALAQRFNINFTATAMVEGNVLDNCIEYEIHYKNEHLPNTPDAVQDFVHELCHIACKYGDHLLSPSEITYRIDTRDDVTYLVGDKYEISAAVSDRIQMRLDSLSEKLQRLTVYQNFVRKHEHENLIVDEDVVKQAMF